MTALYQRLFTMSLMCCVLFCLVEYSHGQDAPAAPQQPTVHQAVRDLGAAATSEAAQVIEKNQAVLQQAGAIGHQMASDFVHPPYDQQPRSLLRSAASGSAKFVGEVTGHTGGLLKGIVSTVGEFGKGVIDSGRSLIGRGVDRVGRSSIVPQPMNPATHGQVVDATMIVAQQPAQPVEVAGGQEATPVVAASNPAPAESKPEAAPAQEPKADEAKPEDAKAEEEKKEEAKPEEERAEEKEEDAAKSEESAEEAKTDEAEEKVEDKKEQAEEKKDEEDKGEEKKEEGGEKKEEGEEKKEEEKAEDSKEEDAKSDEAGDKAEDKKEEAEEKKDEEDKGEEKKSDEAKPEADKAEDKKE